jgi:hypothetical protein
VLKLGFPYQKHWFPFTDAKSQMDDVFTGLVVGGMETA